MRQLMEGMIGGGSPRSLRDLAIPPGLTACVLAPHPDDFDVIGVTLKVLEQKGVALKVAVARTGSGVEDAYRCDLTLAQKARLRAAEQRSSLCFFGLPDSSLEFFDMENGDDDQLLDCEANEALVRRFIQRAVPDLVFLPHGHDTNAGHQHMYSMFKRVAMNYGRPLVVLLVQDPKTVGMRVDLYTGFGQQEADWKATLLRFHDSQHQRNLNTRGYGFDERILKVNRQAAQALGREAVYAEVFEVEVIKGGCHEL